MAPPTRVYQRGPARARGMPPKMRTFGDKMGTIGPNFGGGGAHVSQNLQQMTRFGVMQAARPHGADWGSSLFTTEAGGQRCPLPVVPEPSALAGRMRTAVPQGARAR